MHFSLTFSRIATLAYRRVCVVYRAVVRISIQDSTRNDSFNIFFPSYKAQAELYSAAREQTKMRKNKKLARKMVINKCKHGTMQCIHMERREHSRDGTKSGPLQEKKKLF